MQKIINQFEKTKNDNLLDKLFKQYHFDDIVNYFNEHKNHKDEKFILDYINYLKEEEKNNPYQIYLSGNDVDSNIEKIINLINSPENKLTIISNYSYNSEQFQRIMEKFKKLFPNQTDDISEVITLYGKYQQTEEHIYNAKCIMLDIFESNLCYEEYCSMMGYSFRDIKEAFASLWNTKNEKYKNMLQYIRKRSTTDFYKKINDIANGIYLEKDFDIFTYYQYTKLNMRDLVALINKIVQNNEIKQNVISKLNSLHLKYTIEDFILVNERYVLTVRTLINGREIMPEEKLKILEYMKRNRMHNYYFIYSECLKKYATGELDLDKMQYIKKRIA